MKDGYLLSLSSLLLFFLIIDLYILIPAVVVQVFISTAELEAPIGIPTKETKSEIETHLVTAEAKINKRSI